MIACKRFQSNIVRVFSFLLYNAEWEKESQYNQNVIKCQSLETWETKMCKIQILIEERCHFRALHLPYVTLFTFHTECRPCALGTWKLHDISPVTVGSYFILNVHVCLNIQTCSDVTWNRLKCAYCAGSEAGPCSREGHIHQRGKHCGGLSPGHFKSLPGEGIPQFMKWQKGGQGLYQPEGGGLWMFWWQEGGIQQMKVGNPWSKVYSHCRWLQVPYPNFNSNVTILQKLCTDSSIVSACYKKLQENKWKKCI